MEYGRIYCQEVDYALVRGFSPELRIDVNGWLSNGDPCCEFVYHDVAGAPAGGGAVKMPWIYHLGHLFKTAGDLIALELGEVGEDAMAEAMFTLPSVLPANRFSITRVRRHEPEA